MWWPRKVYFKIVVFFAGFVGLAIATALIVRSNHQPVSTTVARSPAAAELYDEEGELVMAEETLEDLSRGSQRRGRGDLVFQSVNSGQVDPVEVFRKTGIPALRARRVRFNESLFLHLAENPPRTLNLALFEKIHLKVIFQGPSPYGEGFKMFTGQVENDPKSKIRLFVSQGQISGTIDALGRAFRFVSVGNEEHFIIEEESGEGRQGSKSSSGLVSDK